MKFTLLWIRAVIGTLVPDCVVWMLQTMKRRGARIVDVKKQPEEAYARHCREADLLTAPLRDCLGYQNGDGNAEPGSLAYCGGPKKCHEPRTEAQASLEPYVFRNSSA